MNNDDTPKLSGSYLRELPYPEIRYLVIHPVENTRFFKYRRLKMYAASYSKRPYNLRSFATNQFLSYNDTIRLTHIKNGEISNLDYFFHCTIGLSAYTKKDYRSFGFITI